MTRRSKTAVHFYVEDGFLVRGTRDPITALGLAAAEDDLFEMRYGAAELAMRDWSYEDWVPTPEVVDALADLCHRLISEARPGLFRIRPATKYEREDGYAWWTEYANRPGRGAFQGVEFCG